jgi:uncharacterized protein YvpB
MLMALATVVAAIGVTTAWAAPDGVVLPVPYRSQLDGTVWAESNCGPTSIGMVLQAFGQDIPTQTLRDRADQLLGISDPNTGTRIQDLAEVVRGYGLSVSGPYSTPGSFRRWTPDDVRAQLQAGHPVVAQTYYPLLPNHMNNPVPTDHYIVIVGFSGDSFIFNDPAAGFNTGYHQTMTTSQFLRAWGASNVPFGAFSVGPGDDGPPLLPPPTPATAPAPTATPAPEAASAPNSVPAQPSQANGPRPTAPATQASTSGSPASAPLGQPTAQTNQGTATPGAQGKQAEATKPATATTPTPTQQGGNLQPSTAALDGATQGDASNRATPVPLPSLSSLVDRIKANVQAATK